MGAFSLDWAQQGGSADLSQLCWYRLELTVASMVSQPGWPWSGWSKMAHAGMLQVFSMCLFNLSRLPSFCSHGSDKVPWSLGSLKTCINFAAFYWLKQVTKSVQQKDMQRMWEQRGMEIAGHFTVYDTGDRFWLDIQKHVLMSWTDRTACHAPALEEGTPSRWSEWDHLASESPSSFKCLFTRNLFATTKSRFSYLRFRRMGIISPISDSLNLDHVP